jgi:hypothetical protein
VFAALSQNVATQRRPPEASVYKKRIEEALGRKAGLEAFLWALEMQIAAGVQQPCAAPAKSDFCDLMARIGPLAQEDPRMKVAFAPSAPDAADRPQFDALPNAYVLKMLWATRPPGKDVPREQSEQDLLSALKASPVANFCKDAGDFYAQGWQALAAWQVWDFGRLMAGHVDGDLLTRVDTLESDLAKNLPWLF